MCRLVRQLKQRDKSEPMKDEWDELTTPSDIRTIGSGNKLQDLTESIM